MGGNDPLSLELEGLTPGQARGPDAGEPSTWELELLTLFVRNQIKVAFALAALSMLFFVTNLIWTPFQPVALWLACAFAAQGVQLLLCRQYTRIYRRAVQPSEWVGMLTASELLYASCWIVPLFLFWQPGNDMQHIFLIATLMAVVAVRIMISSNYMPVVITGTGFITLGILMRCLIEATPLYVVLGTMAVMIEVFFIQLARRLQENARDMLVYRAQRERLIVELERARDEAERDRKRAEEANRAKSRFLATMSHELRTPLNAIMGFSEILSKEMMGPHQVKAYKNYSADIHNSGHYLLNLINDILDLSRIEAGRLEITDSAVSLVEIAAECRKLVDLKVREKNDTLKIEIPEDCPNLLADARSLRQIWLNLLSNAIKFSPAGSTIVLGVEVLPNQALSMYVTDNGPGIPANELSAALGAFTRGSLATRRAIDGAGLGLPIVNGLARLHEAELDIRSRPGQGTTVSVVFPPKRVMSENQAQLLSAQSVESASQRKLIAITH
ncbi:MAG: ATP-binding protein [Hyphomicrobiales bacterium]